MKRLWICLVLMSIVGWTSGARAQGSKGPAEPIKIDRPDPGPDSNGPRDGMVLGIGVIGGRAMNIDCEDCYTSGAFGIDAQLGGMISPRVALMLDTHAVAWGQSQTDALGVATGTTVQGVAALAAQWWPSPRWWVKGGIGMGEIHGVETTGLTVYETNPEKGFGTTAAVGYEIHQGKVFALDVHARYAGIHIEGMGRASLVVGVGFAWYR